MTTLPPIDTSRRLPQHEPHSIMAVSQTSATYTGSLQELDPSGKPGKFTKMVSELGKRLSGRTTREELVRSNIIKEEVVNVPNALASAKIALEKEREKDKLSSKLQRRPSKTDLKLRNILRVDSNDSIVQAQGGEMLKTIKFDETATKLRSILKKRPERAELEHQNILKSPEGVDPSLAAMVEKMKRVQLENQLENMIRERPSPEEIDMRINFNETVEILPTFRRSEYNRRPDTNATFRKLTPKMKMEIREELNNFKKHEMPVHESSLRNTCFH